MRDPALLHASPWLAATLLACAAPGARPRAPERPTPDVPGWRADLDEMVHDIETIHPNAFTKLPHDRFLARVRALELDLPSLTDEQRVVRTMQIVASLGDGHTHLEPHRADFGDWYPVRIYEFTDGYF